MSVTEEARAAAYRASLVRRAQARAARAALLRGNPAAAAALRAAWAPLLGVANQWPTWNAPLDPLTDPPTDPPMGAPGPL
jgi:type VI protein secretion system component VasF